MRRIRPRRPQKERFAARRAGGEVEVLGEVADEEAGVVGEDEVLGRGLAVGE